MDMTIVEQTAEQLAELKAVLAAQTKEISRKATECERLREAEETRKAELARANELGQQRLETTSMLLVELRTMVQLLVYMVDPSLHRQEDQLSLIVEFIKLMVQREMTDLDNPQRKILDNLRQQLDSLQDQTTDPHRQDLIKQLALARSNVAELEAQMVRLGIRVPLDLIDEVKQARIVAEKLEKELFIS